MIERYSGELAALATACCWTASYLFFTVAVRITGPQWLNRWRLLIAAVLLLGAHAVVYGVPFPVHVDGGRWVWLTLSGVVGFAISDAFLFRALLYLGAHRTSLVTSLIPVVSAGLGWAAFGETMTRIQWLASGAVVLGISLVISARSSGRTAGEQRRTALGVLFAVGTVLTQSLRYIFSKQALSGESLSALSANTVQILAATVSVWGIAFAVGRWRQDLIVLSEPRAAAATLGGAFAGPFVGVTLSMVALSRAQLGVASTLMALPPILLLPLSAAIFRERVSIRAVVGTIIAVGGVASLFLV